jgi:hypothetical protein
MSLALIYYVPQLLETYQTLYTQEQKTLQKQILENKEIIHRNNELTAHIKSINKRAFSYKDTIEKKKKSIDAILPFIIHAAKKSGLTTE